MTRDKHDQITLERLRSTLAPRVTIAKRKRLGQCFTGMLTARVLAAIAFRRGYSRILDPMAGHGDLLEACAERVARRSASANLFGVEIDPEIARIGILRMSACEDAYRLPAIQYCTGDAFDIATWTRCGKAAPFDLVITNPPYVRYQTLSGSTDHDGIALLDAHSTRRALMLLSEKWASASELPIWRDLIRSYSGLADLSVPSWLLCGLITAPGGVLALVVPQTWMNRDYARLIRYYFFRFFRPLAIVEESGRRLFKEVLVPVSLVVGQRLPASETAVPLCERPSSSDYFQHVEISSAAASERSHVGAAFPCVDPEGAFVRWLFDRRPGPRAGMKRSAIPVRTQFSEILSVCANDKWFRKLERGATAMTNTILQVTAALPPTLSQHIPGCLLRNLQPLSSTPVRVGQGLRTGCNAFFYVDETPNGRKNGHTQVMTSHLFGHRMIEVPSATLKPVLRRQAELTGARIRVQSLSGRVLDLRGRFLSQEMTGNGRRQSAADGPPIKLVRATSELATYVCKAASTPGNRTGTLIPELSAVRTNGRGSKIPSHRRGDRQSGTRHEWYMLPDFAPRHLPQLFVPRIVHGRPCVFLNARNPVLVDANFSTLWSDSPVWSSHAIFALLNSTWVQLCMEAIASPMGGGALKVEATHIRRIPVPRLDEQDLKRLSELGKKLEMRHPTAWDHSPELAQIDETILCCLSGESLSTANAAKLGVTLKHLVAMLCRKRRRGVQSGGDT